MVAMRRFLFLLILVVLSIDFSTLDAPRVLAGARTIQWEDEEESAPSRRQRAGAEERRLTASPRSERVLELTPTPRLPERSACADRRARPAAWLAPIRHALVPSASSASASEDH
jgi:hypothetical protein